MFFEMWATDIEGCVIQTPPQYQRQKNGAKGFEYKDGTLEKIPPLARGVAREEFYSDTYYVARL
jgi:hypothetical protein